MLFWNMTFGTHRNQNKHLICKRTGIELVDLYIAYMLREAVIFLTLITNLFVVNFYLLGNLKFDIQFAFGMENFYRD